MLRIAICDDSESDLSIVRQGVEDYLSAQDGLCGRLEVFSSPSAMLDALSQGAAWDVALLDVYMPGLLGTEVARELAAQLKDLRFLFLTTSADFAVEAFALGAVHYLVKPFTREQLFAALDRAVGDFSRRERRSLLLHLENGSTRSVPLEDIQYIESVGRCRVVHTAQEELAEHQQILSALFDRLSALSPGQFILPSRGYIVNQDAILTITTGSILLQGGVSVPLRRGDFRRTRNAYFQWTFRKEGEA